MAKRPPVRHNSGQTPSARHASQAKYEATSVQKHVRAMRNKARALEMSKGLVSKGDGMDVDHRNGNKDVMGKNLRVLSASLNRRMNRRSARTKLK